MASILNRYGALLVLGWLINSSQAAGTVIRIDGNSPGRTFEGIGALSAGASSRLLLDYPERQRDEVLDYLFKPSYGAALQHLKVEIGGDINSTDGTEPSPARTREEMVHPKSAYFERGYEGWLMREARRRNPDIYLDVLQWGAPGWIGGTGSNRSRFYSQDNADFIASFIRCTRKYAGLNIDYCGIWNETAHDSAWIKQLRHTLDQAGLGRVGMVAADDYAEDGWQVVKEMERDSELRAAVARVGVHYRKTQSPANAQAIGCPLWMSEDGPWRGDWTGAETLARMFNRNYLTGKYTKTIIWSLVTAYYDVLPLPDSGPMLAKEPWSGHFEVQPALWAIAHTTQFTHPGWRYLDAGCGLLDGGSYVTLRSPGRAGDYSIILETTEARQAQTLQFSTIGLSDRTLHVWRSDSRAQFEPLPDLASTDGTFSVTVDPDAIYSLSTTTGQSKGRSLAPPAAEFPLPYQDDFESYPPGKYARYFSDQGGVFEVARRPDGKGQCLRQALETNGIDWPFHPTPEPYSLIGSAQWRDYEVSVSTFIEKTGSVSVWGRIQASLQNAQPAEGYWLQVASDGRWQLHAFTNLLAAGTILVAPHQWHDLKLRFSGPAITALVDRQMIATVQDRSFSQGMAGVGSGWNTALFDDFSLRPLANTAALKPHNSSGAPTRSN